MEAVVADALSEEFLEQTPNRPAVFVLWPRGGEPYLARTNVLKRRLSRLARMGKLRENISKVEIWYTGSALEAHAKMYELARIHFPSRYLELLHLRMPPYVKLLLGNQFPRTAVSSQFSSGNAVVCGPFRSRASAERFEEGFLDLFQLRRCQDDLSPSPDHPGCMYGEMGKCLRPCQEVVGQAEYRSEVNRVERFLETGGRSLTEPAETARERFSIELDFEQAARQHDRIARIEEVMKLRDELAKPLDRLNGIAILPSAQPNAVELAFVRGGYWQGIFRISFGPESLDRKLRELILGVGAFPLPARDRQEYLAIFARWFYSSWRDGEYLPVESFDDVPYRKLVNAVSRVHREVV
jgi:excinuclease ABC subunit C